MKIEFLCRLSRCVSETLILVLLICRYKNRVTIKFVLISNNLSVAILSVALDVNSSG